MRDAKQPVQSTRLYTRTPGERSDQSLSWERPDKAFFAGGACHILAFAFAEQHPELNPKIVLLKPHDDAPGTHVFVRHNQGVFDFNGWSQEAELLEAAEADYRQNLPDWSYDLIPVDINLATFCEDHWHRPPEEFHQLPWDRARDFIMELGG